MLDAPAVRHELYAWLDRTLCRNTPCLVLNEVPLGLRLAFADVVLVSNELIGFEIKSDVDSLRRLAQQVRYYSRTFDRVAVVGTERYAGTLPLHVPQTWGIYCATPGALHVVRETQSNPDMDPAWMLDMLRRDELERIARQNHLAGYWRSTKDALIERIATTFTEDECRVLICRALRSRSDWGARQLDTTSFSFAGFPQEPPELSLNPSLVAPI